MGLGKIRTDRLIKLSRKRKKERGYFGTVAKVAPVFGAKAVLGDLPRNFVKKRLERTWSKGGLPRAPKVKIPKSKPMLFPKARASWGKLPKAVRMTAAGGAIGIATAPVFLKGIQLASSDKKSDKMKGIGMIAGSGAVFQGLKGLNEGGLPRALSRISVKTPGAIGLGLAIAAGRKKKKGKKSTFSDKYLKPALYSAAVGGVQGGVDKIYEAVGEAPKGRKLKTFKKLFTSRKGLKSLRGYAGAGAVAGGIGGLIASAVVDKAVKALKE